MTRRKDTLGTLWLSYVNQPTPPSEITMHYVAALRARIDQLELECAHLRGRLWKSGMNDLDVG